MRNHRQSCRTCSEPTEVFTAIYAKAGVISLSWRTNSHMHLVRATLDKMDWLTALSFAALAIHYTEGNLLGEHGFRCAKLCEEGACVYC